MGPTQLDVRVKCTRETTAAGEKGGEWQRAMALLDQLQERKLQGRVHGAPKRPDGPKVGVTSEEVTKGDVTMSEYLERFGRCSPSAHIIADHHLSASFFLSGMQYEEMHHIGSGQFCIQSRCRLSSGRHSTTLRWRDDTGWKTMCVSLLGRPPGEPHGRRTINQSTI